MTAGMATPGRTTIDRDARFPYRTPPEIADGSRFGQTPVAIVGAGPIGLAMAVDLAQHGIASVVLDDNDRVSVGSRAICWAKRTLEIFDRLGIGERIVDKGVTWKVGRLFDGRDEVYSFDLLPEAGHRMPAFVNLQQYYVEHFLVERCADFPDLIDLRWRNAVVRHEARADGVRLNVETPDGAYALQAEWMLACDGARSATRERMGLAFEGQAFEERFLIADVAMDESPFPTNEPERWFWFHPPFHVGQSALLHQQPDNIYRIDLQLGPDADPEAERDPDRVMPRIRRMVGDKPFELDWLSVYRFTCARLERFVHGRVVFVGDSAHVVSPFGARGGNGGVQDVDNLGWKLAAVLHGKADEALIATYDEERGHAANENIANSARATAFMTPKNATETAFRDAVLGLAHDHPFARRLINSGRLSTPASLAGRSQTLSGPSDPRAAQVSGTPCPDAPLTDGWLLSHLGGRWVVLTIGGGARDAKGPPGVSRVHVALPNETSQPGDLVAADGLLEARYGTNLAYLIRPDQHIAASGTPDAMAEVHAALQTAEAESDASRPAPADPNTHDRLYASLMDLFEGRNETETRALHARLTLLLIDALGTNAPSALEKAISCSAPPVTRDRVPHSNEPVCPAPRRA